MPKAISLALFVFMLALFFGAVSSPAAFATHGGEAPPAGKALPTGPKTGTELFNILDAIANWVFAGFLVLATIFIIVAALQFLTGGGEPAQVAQARMKLLWAVVAIAIAAAAKGLPVAVRHIVGV